MVNIQDKWEVAIGLGTKLNFWGPRPYWGEKDPWNNKYSLNNPYIKTTYFVPGSPNAARRQILAYRGRSITGRNILSAMGNVNIQRILNEKWGIRFSLAYSHGLGIIRTTPVATKRLNTRQKILFMERLIWFTMNLFHNVIFAQVGRVATHQYQVTNPLVIGQKQGII